MSNSSSGPKKTRYIFSLLLTLSLSNRFRYGECEGDSRSGKERDPADLSPREEGGSYTIALYIFVVLFKTGLVSSYDT